MLGKILDFICTRLRSTEIALASRTVLSNHLKSLPDTVKCVIETSLVYHRYTINIPD